LEDTFERDFSLISIENPYVMKKGSLIIFFICAWGYSQVENPSDSIGSGNLGLDITTFAYPMFLDKEQHSYFLINYKISEKLEADLQGFYDMYMLSNRFRTSLILKRYLTEKFYVFSGIEVKSQIIRGSRHPCHPESVRLWALDTM